MKSSFTLSRYLLCCVLLCVIGSSYQVSGTKLLTYNTLMLPRFEKYNERKPLLLDNLRNADSDVVCLQEVFYGGDVVAITDQLKNIYPYSYSAIHRNEGIKPGPPCLGSDLLVLACVQSNGCLNAKTDAEQLQCSIIKCSAFQILSQNCLTCIIVSGSNATNLQNNCVMSAIDFNTDGLILLSKNRITDTQRIEYHPGIVQIRSTSYLQAKIQNVGQVRCTHLVAYDIPQYVDPNMPYTSFYEQVEVEVKLLLKNTCNQDQMIIMGDLNIGPSVPSNGVAGLYEDLYMEFIRRDFTSPYVDLVGKCTYCVTENNLVSIWPTDKIIDYVMVKGYTAKHAKRKFDTLPPASDHYGVEISI